MQVTRGIRLAWLAALLAVVFCLGAVTLGYWSRAHTITAPALGLGIAALFALMAAWHGYLLRGKLREEEGQRQLQRDYGRDDLFADDEASLRLAADAYRTFTRYLLPGYTLLKGLLILLAVAMLFRAWGAPGRAPEAADAVSLAGLAAFLLVFSALIGSYFNGVSRETGCRWLRPVGHWFLFAAVQYALVVAVMLARKLEIGDWDQGVGSFLLLLHGLLGAELLANFVLEFYRPRTQGEEQLPLYESRLLSFVTQPGGIARNVAYALDYQFGFHVSETWFYRFLERAVVPLLLVMAMGLYLLDCVVQVDTSHKAVRETYWFGSAAGRTVLGSGLHLKLPWPLQRITTYPVLEVRQVDLGLAHGAEQKPGEPPPDAGPPEMQGDPTGKIVVWNKRHFAREEYFLMASREMGTEAPPVQPAAGPRVGSVVPVNFMNCGLTVSYRIGDTDADLLAYAYHYQDPEVTLRDVGSRELEAYLATHDFLDIVGPRMLESQAELRQRIEAAVARLEPPSGVQVVFVGLTGIHPPVDVADAFQRVVGAKEEREARILTARSYAARRELQARGQSDRVVNDSMGYRATQVRRAEGERDQFLTQLRAFDQAPDVFMMRKRLELIEEKAMGVRKFLVAGDSREVYILDLSERLRPDLLQNLDVNAQD